MVALATGMLSLVISYQQAGCSSLSSPLGDKVRKLRVGAPCMIRLELEQKHKATRTREEFYTGVCCRGHFCGLDLSKMTDEVEQ